MSTSLERGERLIGFGFLVFALNGYGLPWANCATCKGGFGQEHMVTCDCTLCHGFYRATDVVEELAWQLQLRPWSILGIRTGLASRLLVMDFDCHEGMANGVELHADLVAANRLEPTPQVATGGGGIHRYYRLDEPCRTLAGFRPGLDVKADGGYVVAPGFAKKERPAYRELTGYHLGFDDIALADAPAWVLDELIGAPNVGVLRRPTPINPFGHQTRDPVAAFERALTKLAEGKVGGRNTGVFVCGCKARIVADRGLGDVAEMAARANRVALQVGLTDSQFVKQWNSGVSPVAQHRAPTPLTRK